MNREALESAWVRREANILLWRMAVNSSFVVVPARLGGIKTDDLKQNGFYDVSRLQMAQIDQVTETSADAEALAAKILACLASRPPDDDPMVRWITRVAERVRETAPQLRHYLDEAADKLGIAAADLPKNWDVNESHRLLAAQLLGESLRGARLQKAADALADAFDRRDPFERLIVDIRPSWVDGQAARMLLPPPPGDNTPADRRVLILNAYRTETASYYLARATFNKTVGYDHIDVTAEIVGEGGAQELIARFEHAIRDNLCAEDYLPDDHNLPHDAETIYYLLVRVGNSALGMVAEAVRQVQEWYPWLVIVLLAGFCLPDEAKLESVGLNAAVVVTPALAKDDEAFARQMLRKLAELGNRWNISVGVA